MRRGLHIPIRFSLGDGVKWPLAWSLICFAWSLCFCFPVTDLFSTVGPKDTLGFSVTLKGSWKCNVSLLIYHLNFIMDFTCSIAFFNNIHHIRKNEIKH